MKLFSKVVIYLMSISGVILLVLPISWFPSFYDVRYMGAIGILGAIIIKFVPQLVNIFSKQTSLTEKEKTIDLLRFLLAFAFIGNAIGDLGLYKLYIYGFEYDKVLHFLDPALGVIIIAIILSQILRLSKQSSILISLSILIAFGVIWEIYEAVADYILQTHISGVYGMQINSDTKVDLMFDILGSLSGALICVYFWDYLNRRLTAKKSVIIKNTSLVVIILLIIGFLAAHIKI